MRQEDGQLAERVHHVIGPKPGFEPIGHAQAVALNLRLRGSPIVLNGQDDGPHRKGDEVNIRQQQRLLLVGVRCARLGAHQQRAGPCSLGGRRTTAWDATGRLQRADPLPLFPSARTGGPSPLSWHTSLVTNSESWRGDSKGPRPQPAPPHLRGSRRLSHSFARVFERTKHRRGVQHTQWCEILPRSTPLTSDRGTIGAISATFHVSARSRTSSGMPRTKASCDGSTARESKEQPQVQRVQRRMATAMHATRDPQGRGLAPPHAPCPGRAP